MFTHLWHARRITQKKVAAAGAWKLVLIFIPLSVGSANLKNATTAKKLNYAAKTKKRDFGAVAETTDICVLGGVGIDPIVMRAKVAARG